MELTLNGKRAVRVNAKVVTWGTTSKAKLYDIDGDQKWVPNSVSKFENSKESQEQLERGVHRGNITGTLLIEEWFFKRLFPTG